MTGIDFVKFFIDFHSKMKLEGTLTQVVEWKFFSPDVVYDIF